MIRWGDGQEPKDLTWVLPERLCVCECPGGWGPERRRNRLEEEIIWIRKSGIDVMVSLVSDSEIKQLCEEARIPYAEIPMDSLPSVEVAVSIFAEFAKRMDEGQKLMLYSKATDEVIAGLLSGYLLWRGLATTVWDAERTILEVLDRGLGPSGRRMLVELEKLAKDDAGAQNSTSSKLN